jgi:hypothetical protein
VKRHKVAVLSFFCLFILAIGSCRKYYSKEGNELPLSLQEMINNGDACGTCPFNIQKVTVKKDTYFKIVPVFTSEVICDYASFIAFYDAAGNLVPPDSDLYSRILSDGKNREIVFECP